MSASTPGESTGNHRTFSGNDEDVKEYRRWKTWTMNKLLTLGDKVPREARGAYVYTLLHGKALECVEHLEVSEYQKEDGDKLLFKLLDERFPQRDNTDEMAETLNSVFSLRAAEGETLKTWVSRASELFDRCQRKCNVTFPEEARGWIILRRSGLTEEQQAVVLARSLGVLKREEVSKAMRSCYPDFSVPKKRAAISLVEDNSLSDLAMDDSEPTDHVTEFDDVEQLLAQHEVCDDSADTEVYPETEVADILAVSWREKRKEINKMQRSRKFGAATDLKKQFRVEIEEVKKKTRCHRCGRIGHWSRECKMPRADQKGNAGQSSSSSTARKDSGLAYVEHFIAAVTFQPTVLEQLRLRRNQDEADQRRATVINETLLVSSPGYGVLDSGCGKSIMGQSTYESFCKLWRDRNIPVPQPYPEVNHFRFGNGEKETSEVSIKAPVMLAGKTGVIKVALVKGEAPLLVSRKALQALHAKLDFSKGELTVFDEEAVVPLQVNDAGQYIVPLLGESESARDSFDEVMINEPLPPPTEPTSLPAESLDESIPAKPDSGPDVQLSEWSVECSFIPKAFTTGKQGPKWSSVKRRIITDLDTGKIVFDEHVDPKLGKAKYHQPLPKHVMRSKSTFMFNPEENHPAVAECLSVRHVRQLQSQVNKTILQHDRKRANSKPLMIAEVFSPPRFSPVVQAQGMRGISFDLKNGFDLSKPEVRKQVKQQLKF